MIFPSWLKKKRYGGFRAVLATAIHSLRESSNFSGSLMRPDYLKKRIKVSVKENEVPTEKVARVFSLQRQVIS